MFSLVSLLFPFARFFLTQLTELVLRHCFPGGILTVTALKPVRSSTLPFFSLLFYRPPLPFRSSLFLVEYGFVGEAVLSPGTQV